MEDTAIHPFVFSISNDLHHHRPLLLGEAAPRPCTIDLAAKALLSRQVHQRLAGRPRIASAVLISAAQFGLPPVTRKKVLVVQVTSAAGAGVGGSPAAPGAAGSAVR